MTNPVTDEELAELEAGLVTPGPWSFRLDEAQLGFIARLIATIREQQERIAALEADKSICIAAILFASEEDVDAADFLTCWLDGSTETDDEWADWREEKIGLVLHGAAARAALQGPKS